MIYNGLLSICQTKAINEPIFTCESNPDVISTPIQVGKSKRYSIRRFFFLYHGTLSSATILVMIGSATPSVECERIPMMKIQLNGSNKNQVEA